MKLVPESLNELQNFDRGLNPKSTIGIGMGARIKEIIQTQLDGLDMGFKMASIPILDPVGRNYQWQDKFGANWIEFSDMETRESELYVQNSEDGSKDIEGSQQILDFLKSDGLAKFINLE